MAVDCKFSMSPAPNLMKEGDEQVFTMDPKNFGTCSVSATAEGDLEVINVQSDGTVRVRAKSDKPVGKIHVVKRCTASADPEMPAECGPTEVVIDIGKPGKFTLGAWLLIILAGLAGFGIGWGVSGSPIGGVLFGLGCAGGVISLIALSK